MRLLHVSRYFFREAIGNLWTNRLNNVVSVAIIAFSLFTLGLFILTASNLTRLISHWTENVQVSVFLHKGTTREQTSAIESTIKLSPCVARYKFVSEEEALARFKEYYPQMSRLSSELDTNPFPPSYEIAIRKEFQNRDAVQQFVSQLKSANAVDDVEYDQDWIDRLQFIIAFIRIVGIVFGGILLFTAIFSISNVIKLMVLSRRDEIEIMRLVGATNSFIKGPFLTEGILQGVLGGMTAVVILFAVFTLIVQKVAALKAPFFSVGQLQFLPSTMIFALLASGMIVGFFGSLISLSKLLKI